MYVEEACIWSNGILEISHLNLVYEYLING